MLLNIIHLETSDVKPSEAFGATQWLTFQAILDLFPLKDFSPQQVQPQGSIASIHSTNRGLTHVN